MENRFPLFAGGRILKKEGLWDVRDYTYCGWQLYYDEYSDGLLKGCEIRVDGKELVIGKGMIKFRGFIYLIFEEVRIKYEPEDKWVSLKAEFHKDETHPDYVEFGVNFYIDEELELKDNQIEMCRFYLRKGSTLRDTYKGFYDMETEYDTINLISATVSGPKEQTLHPTILKHFVEELWIKKEKEVLDYSFCLNAWNENVSFNRKMILEYICDKKKETSIEEIMNYENNDIYSELKYILNFFGTSTRRKAEKNVILVD